MGTVKLTYDADRHGVGEKEPGHKMVAIGCTYHGSEIEDFSAGDLLTMGVAGSMLFSMGVQARHDRLDIKGTEVDVHFSVTDKPFPHLDTVALTFNMPHDFSAKEREALEAAAGRCPLKASFRSETKITATFRYPSEAAKRTAAA